MIHAPFKLWQPGEFDPDGDCMQRAEYVSRIENGKLVQEYFVLRSADGTYCGREVLLPEVVCSNCCALGHRREECTDYNPFWLTYNDESFLKKCGIKI